MAHRDMQQRPENAFTGLVDSYQRQVYSLAYRMLGNPTDAADATQEAFVCLYRGYDALDGSRPEGPWVMKVATNAILKYFRSNKRHRHAAPTEPVSERSGCRAERRELAALLEHQIGRLDPESRAAVVLHYLHGMTKVEVARMLGCPRTTLQSRMERALERMKAGLPLAGVPLPIAGLEQALRAIPTLEVPRALSPRLLALVVKPSPAIPLMCLGGVMSKKLVVVAGALCLSAGGAAMLLPPRSPAAAEALSRPERAATARAAPDAEKKALLEKIERLENALALARADASRKSTAGKPVAPSAVSGADAALIRRLPAWMKIVHGLPTLRAKLDAIAALPPEQRWQPAWKLGSYLQGKPGEADEVLRVLRDGKPGQLFVLGLAIRAGALYRMSPEQQAQLVQVFVSGHPKEARAAAAYGVRHCLKNPQLVQTVCDAVVAGQDPGALKVLADSLSAHAVSQPRLLGALEETLPRTAPGATRAAVLLACARGRFQGAAWLFAQWDGATEQGLKQDLARATADYLNRGSTSRSVIGSDKALQRFHDIFEAAPDWSTRQQLIRGAYMNWGAPGKAKKIAFLGRLAQQEQDTVNRQKIERLIELVRTGSLGGSADVDRTLR